MLASIRPTAAAGRLRRLAFVGVLVGVAVLHAVVTRAVAEQMEASDPATAMPARMEVAYVRTIEISAPPVVAPRPAAAAVAGPAAPRAPHLPKKPAPAASAPAAAEPEEPAPAAAEAAPAASSADQAAVAAWAAAAPTASEPAAAEATVATASAATSEAAAGTAVAAASEPAGDAFEWPASTRVVYALTGNYRGEVSGNAQVEWVKRGGRYQIHLDFSVGPEFAPLIARRMTSEGRIAVDGLAPERYDEETQVVFRDRRRNTVLFEPDEVVLANGQRRERWAGVQDTASQFVQFTYLFSTQPELLKVGNSFELPVALPRSLDRMRFDVLDEQPLVTPFGTLQAFHLKPRRSVRKSSDLAVEMWFAPALRYLPVRIRIEQDAANFVDLVIAAKPQMAAAAATVASDASLTASRMTP